MKLEFTYNGVAPCVVLTPETGSDRDFLRWLCATKTPPEERTDYSGGPVSVDVANTFAQVGAVYYPTGREAGERMAVLVKKPDGDLAVLVAPRSDLGHITEGLIQNGYQPQHFDDGVPDEDIVDGAQTPVFKPGRFRTVVLAAVPHEILDNAAVEKVADLPRPTVIHQATD